MIVFIEMLFVLLFLFSTGHGQTIISDEQLDRYHKYSETVRALETTVLDLTKRQKETHEVFLVIADYVRTAAQAEWEKEHSLMNTVTQLTQRLDDITQVQNVMEKTYNELQKATTEIENNKVEQSQSALLEIIRSDMMETQQVVSDLQQTQEMTTQTISSLELDRQLNIELKSDLEQMRLKYTENKLEEFPTALMDIVEIEENVDIIRADVTTQESMIDLQQTQLDAMMTNISSLDEEKSDLRSDFEQMRLRYSEKGVTVKIMEAELSSILNDDPAYSAEIMIVVGAGANSGVIVPNHWATTKLEAAPWYKATLGRSVKIISISFEGDSKRDGDSYTFSVTDGASEEQCGYYEATKVGLFKIKMACGGIGTGFKITAHNSQEEGTRLRLHEVECQITEI